jgi:hypothetical protein
MFLITDRYIEHLNRVKTQRRNGPAVEKKQGRSAKQEIAPSPAESALSKEKAKLCTQGSGHNQRFQPDCPLPAGKGNTFKQHHQPITIAGRGT